MAIFLKGEDEATLQDLISSISSLRMSGKSTYTLGLGILLREQAEREAWRWKQWYRTSYRGLSCRVDQKVGSAHWSFLSYHPCEGRETGLSAAPIYLHSLYARLDECVNNIAHSEGMTYSLMWIQKSYMFTCGRGSEQSFLRPWNSW